MTSLKYVLLALKRAERFGSATTRNMNEYIHRHSCLNIINIDWASMPGTEEYITNEAINLSRQQLQMVLITKIGLIIYTIAHTVITYTYNTSIKTLIKVPDQ